MMSTVRVFSTAAARKSSFVSVTKCPFSYSKPLTRSSHATGLPSRTHTRSNLIGEWSLACSMRNDGREWRTAVCSSTGMLTRPNAIEPFQSARAMSAFRLLPLEFLFGLEPIVDVTAVLSAAEQVPMVGAEPNFLFVGLARHRFGDGRFR